MAIKNNGNYSNSNKIVNNNYINHKYNVNDNIRFNFPVNNSLFIKINILCAIITY